ncbi:MAG: tetratricopeptide repeat protein [Rhizobacter sp.]|nr:tetratricopeptide repeat protein [Ferruginibacter sp.]
MNNILKKLIVMAVFAAFLITGNAQVPVAVSIPFSSEQPNQQPDSNYLYWKEKSEDYHLSNNLFGEAECLQQMGQLLYQLGNYSGAIEKLLAAHKIYAALNNKEAQAKNGNILGTVYYYNQQAPKALEQFREALAIFSSTKNHTGLANTYGAIGHLYEKNKLFDSAFHFQQVALNHALLGKDLNSQAKIYEHIGSILEDQARFDSARYYFEQSLTLYKQTGNLISRIEVINNLGDVYQKSGDYVKGLAFAREAMQLALENKAIYQLQTAYRDMGQNFAFMKRHDSAYIYLEKSRSLVQQIYTMESSRQIALQETIYGTEKQHREIERLNAGKKINRVLIVLGSILIVLLCLLGAVTISRQRLKIRNQKSINERNDEIYHTQKGLMESELKRQQLQEENLQQQLDLKSTELSSHILHLIQKNQVMEDIKQGLSEIINDDKRDQKKQVRQLLQKINFSFSQDSYWDEFRLIFDQVHPSFFTNLTQQYSSLGAADLRLLSLIKMNLTSADMATLLAITPDSLRVNRYRIKKKLQLAQGESLSTFIQAI